MVDKGLIYMRVKKLDIGPVCIIVKKKDRNRPDLHKSLKGSHRSDLVSVYHNSHGFSQYILDHKQQESK